MNPTPTKRRRTGMNTCVETYDNDNDNDMKDTFYKINSIQDLINIAKSLKRRRNADFSRLKNLLPELEKLNSMIGMENLKKSITTDLVVVGPKAAIRISP